MARLAFVDVSKSYATAAGRQWPALEDVTFELEAGRRVAVVGRSGSGKSTLLHLAAGIEVPTSGSVLFEGRDLAGLSDNERTLLRRRQVGLVFQFFHLLSHLSVAENVALPEMIASSRPAEYQARVMELLERVGLGQRAGDRIQELSGGEQQRVALCRALLHRPSLVLADEPTGNLDDDNAAVVLDLLFELADEHSASLLYATHSRTTAARADEVWQLHSGRLDAPAAGAEAEVGL